MSDDLRSLTDAFNEGEKTLQLTIEETLEAVGRLPWEVVESSNVEALAFTETEGIIMRTGENEAAHVESIGYLWIRFKNGKVYCYPEVPQTLYKIVLNADSVGSAFNRLIVKKYPYLGGIDITTGAAIEPQQ